MVRTALTAVLCLGALTASTGVAAATPATSVKAPIVGLIDKSSEASYHLGVPYPTVPVDEVAPDAAAFAGILVNQTWRQLEPSPGRFSFTALDRSVAAVRAYDTAHPTHPLAIRLRVFAAFAAPDWAKTLDGPPITVTTRTHASATNTDGQWWKPRYRAAWSALQHALAARYDREPLLRSVAVSSCSSLTAEPFVISGNPAVLGQLLADGWSGAAQQHCLDGAFADYDGWKRTPLEYAINPLPTPRAGGKGYTPDLPATYEVMGRCASLLSKTGRSCALANHALTSLSGTTGRSAPVYAHIDSLFAETRPRLSVAFQTNAPDTFGGCAAIAVAVAHHAQSVELWPPSGSFSGFRGFSLSALTGWAQALSTGRGPRC